MNSRVRFSVQTETLIELTGYFQKVASLPNITRRLYKQVRNRRRRSAFYSSTFIGVAFTSVAFLQNLNNVENLNISSMNFELC